MSFFKTLFGSSDNSKFSQINYNKFFTSIKVDDISVEVVKLGDLDCPTGEIVVCDPLVFLGRAKPFTKKVNAGRYSVEVCVAKTHDAGDRYAIAKLQFTEQPAVKWEMALLGHQKVKDLKQDDSYFGFPVDAGLGCFCDIRTQTLFDQWQDNFDKANPGCNIYDDYFEAEFKKNAKDQNDPTDVGDWVNFEIPGHADHNVIMFQSGYGDGVYPSYWGLTDSNEVCCLVIDFLIFEG